MPPRRPSILLGLVVVVALIVLGSVLVPRSGPPGGSATATATMTAAATTTSTATTTAVAASMTPTATTTRASASPRPAIGHVWWIVMENHEYDSIIGNASVPYLNGLASKYELLTNSYSTSHPSEPNYIAMVAGSTLGVTSDGTYDLTAPSIFSQLTAAGKAWRAYEQDIEPGCFTGGSAPAEPDGPGAVGAYARKHNPAISFTYVSGSPTQCANIHPLRDFDPEAAAFSFITPNLINDMHDGSPAQGDAFLRAFVPLITDSPAFASGVLFITFDEGSSGAGSHGDGGGHVATLVIAPGMAPGTRYSTYADHYSLLRTTQDLLGLPCLAASCSRTALLH